MRYIPVCRYLLIVVEVTTKMSSRPLHFDSAMLLKIQFHLTDCISVQPSYAYWGTKNYP